MLYRYTIIVIGEYVKHHYLINFRFGGGKGRKTPVEELTGKSGKSVSSKPDTESGSHRQHLVHEEQRWRHAEDAYEKYGQLLKYANDPLLKKLGYISLLMLVN